VAAEIDAELDERTEAPAKMDKKDRAAMRKEAKATVRTPEEWRNALKYKVKIFYDLQLLRMQAAGRGKKKADGAEVQLNEIDIALLDARSTDLARAELDAKNDIIDQLATSKLYTTVLSDKTRFKGLGPTMAAVILSSFDIERADTVSKMWSFAGLAPVPTKRCKTCQGILKEESDGLYKHAWKTKEKCPEGDPVGLLKTFDSAMAMKPVKGEKLSYNNWLKTKLVGVMGGCLLKANSPWRKFYDDYKHRKASAGWGRDDGHRHQAAMRYMVKMLLLEIWKEWRTIEGLTVRPSYQEQYLGHVHGAGVSAAV
jgi:hypothetical protein